MGALEAVCEADCALSIVGADCEVLIDDKSYRSNRSYLISPSERLEVSAPESGARVYLAAPGGWEGEWSRGAVVTRKNQTGDRKERRLALPPGSLSQDPLRVVPGAHADRFDLSALARRYEVGPLIDRMGLRLLGEPLPKTPEIVSEACAPGTIQVSNDGSLLIHGPDGPTIGGYPKLAHVISADLDRLGQLRPGDSVRFQRIQIEEARELWRERQARLDKLLPLLRVGPW